MSKLPIVARKRGASSDPIDTKTGELTVSEGKQSGQSSRFPLFGFSYSYNEITLVDGRARVRSRRARFEDGKLQTEEFDGTLGGAAYARAVAETQRLIAEQATFVLRQFSHFLRFWGK